MRSDSEQSVTRGLGVVVIGRNEGPKLERCLRSVLGRAGPLVYVDSASDDGSANLARALGAGVVELDSHIPFTAARARNAGLAKLLELDPAIELVQFLDADSEMCEPWFAAAAAAMADDPRLGATYGRLRERFPTRSAFTRLYRVDFDERMRSPDTCTGISLMRVSAFRAVGGFASSMLALEDREISFRLRQAGWPVRALSTEMAVHDSGLDSVRAWWRRRVRGGHALAHEVSLHTPAAASARRSFYSSWFWGLGVPLATLAATPWTTRASLLFLGAYAVLFGRVFLRLSLWGFGARDAATYAVATVASKLPQVVGQLRFYLGRCAPRDARLALRCVEPRDLLRLGGIPILALVAWTVPDVHWPHLCGGLARLRRRARAGDGVEHLRALLAGHTAGDRVQRAAWKLAANRHQARLLLLRCHRPDRPLPRMTLVGGEHLAAAQAAGRGTILWVAPFVFSDLITKAALWRAGFRVTHLSRSHHGFSHSRFGARMLNPIWTSVERRYVADRLVMAPDQSVAALREVITRLRDRQIVSITIGFEAQRRQTVPFLRGTIALADGAAGLALRSGAALLPVFSIRLADGSFRTTIESPLAAPGEVPRREAARALVAQVATLLASYALQWPGQFSAWTIADPRPP